MKGATPVRFASCSAQQPHPALRAAVPAAHSPSSNRTLVQTLGNFTSSKVWFRGAAVAAPDRKQTAWSRGRLTGGARGKFARLLRRYISHFACCAEPAGHVHAAVFFVFPSGTPAVSLEKQRRPPECARLFVFRAPAFSPSSFLSSSLFFSFSNAVSFRPRER